MLFFLSHNFAHRLLRGGTVESAPITERNVGAKKEYSFIEGDFLNYSPREMNLTGGQFEDIKNKLEYFHTIMPEDFRLPVSEQPEEKQFVATDPR